jgi:hypothetical protein
MSMRKWTEVEMCAGCPAHKSGTTTSNRCRANCHSILCFFHSRSRRRFVPLVADVRENGLNLSRVCPYSTPIELNCAGQTRKVGFGCGWVVVASPSPSQQQLQHMGPSASAALFFSSELAKQPKKKRRNPKLLLLQSLLAGIRPLFGWACQHDLSAVKQCFSLTANQL